MKLVAGSSFVLMLVLSFAVNAQTTTAVADRIQREAQAFRLEDVRLLPGPFKDAMTRDGEYLLRLNADRLLHGFRKEAGLEPKAEAYGGWESRQIAGETCRSKNCRFTQLIVGKDARCRLRIRRLSHPH